MPKKKITVGHSSKNGQKVLQEKYIYGERTLEQIEALSEQHQEIEIDFPPSKISDFERMAYESCEIIAEFHKSQGRNLEPNQHLELFKREAQDELFENVKKLYLLCDHYGIDPNNPQHFMLLSIELARELFPYSPAKVKGRKRKWSEAVEAIFVIDMEKLIKQGHSDSNAGRILARNPVWSNFIETRSAGGMGESMRTEYSKIKKKVHIKESRKRFDQMTPTEFEEQRKKLVRKLPTF